MKDERDQLKKSLPILKLASQLKTVIEVNGHICAKIISGLNL